MLILIVAAAAINPFRTVVLFRGQTTLILKYFCPRHETAVLKGVSNVWKGPHVFIEGIISFN